MKKLTAGIFAGILGMVSMGAADANVASTGWVNDQLADKADVSTVTALEGTVQGLDTAVQGLNTSKAAASDVSALAGRVKDAEDDIDAIDLKIGTGTLPLEATTITDALIKIDGKTASNTDVTNLKTSVKTLEGSVETLSGLVGTTSVGTQITGALTNYYTQDEINNKMLLKQDASTAVKHTENTAVGSATVPVYIDENGNAIEITSYSGKAAAAASADYATAAGSADSATTATNYVAGGAIDTGLASKVNIPSANADTSGFGKFVLTANVSDQGPTIYYWEQIERAVVDGVEQF